MASNKVKPIANIHESVLTWNSSGITTIKSVTDLSSPLSSTYDLLKSMTDTGLLCLDDDRNYRTGLRFIQLCTSASRSPEREIPLIRDCCHSTSTGDAISGIFGLAVPVWIEMGRSTAAGHVSGFRDVISEGNISGSLFSMQGCAGDTARAVGVSVRLESNLSSVEIPAPTTQADGKPQTVSLR